MLVIKSIVLGEFNNSFKKISHKIVKNPTRYYLHKYSSVLN